MGPEFPVELPKVCRDLLALGVRFVVVGRQAVRLYGSPAFTSDYDLWVHPESRSTVLQYFEVEYEAEIHLPPNGATNRAKIHCELDRADLTVLASITNQEGLRLSLDDVISRAVNRADGLAQGYIPIPCLDDLIAVKKCRLPHPRDEEDLRYLLVRKALETSGEL